MGQSYIEYVGAANATCKRRNDAGSGVRHCTALADARRGRYPAHMSTITKPSITPRAKAIAEGLVRSGRATKFQVSGGFVRADGIGTAIYWVTSDGTRVLRGDVPHSADELQTGFVEKMFVAGSGA